MKGNLPSKEPKIQEFWLQNKIYQKILKNSFEAEQKILHDGPPYANGNIHIGHALNKILKDILVRRWMSEGYYSSYIPGWDTHGMPIEHALIKKGVNVDKNLSVSQKRKNCRNFALQNIENQKVQFARLGWVTDCEQYYSTLTNDFEINQLKVFFKAIEKGLAYQDLKPVYWSWSSKTALAEAEVEYMDLSSNSIYLTFKVIENKGKIFKDDLLLVWTTTGWTLPSNQAIAVNPKFEYVRVKYKNNFYIIAKTRIEEVSKILNWNNFEIVESFFGNEMELIKYSHPIYNLNSFIILAEYVLDSNGSGLVHNASGFGKEDYLACKKYNIKPFSPIDGDGKFNEQINQIDPELFGKFYEDTNEIIIEKLRKSNALLFCEKITHSAAIDWRTKKPVMFRSTKQWFIDIENIKQDMEILLEQIQYPHEVNKIQLKTSIMERAEWCISRQRYWGVPIPIIYDEEDKPIFDNELNQNILQIFEKETTDVWYEKPAEYFLTSKYKDGRKYSKEIDILDVWFDSGTSWTVLEQNKLQYPCEIYLEGKDQFRGWFNSSLICSTIMNNTAPYKRLLGCGYVVDQQGRKMSKSLGNGVDPLDICNKYGADILRLWTATTKYTDDAKIGEEILKQVSEIYRRIRNTLFKFILSNISDFNPAKNWNEEYEEKDLLILHQLRKNISLIKEHYNSFEFSDIVDIINNHTIELSGWYFDIIKDSLYCDEKDNKKRRVVQTVLYQIFFSYLHALVPIIPHTCEEAYSSFIVLNKKESICLVTTKDLDFNNKEINNICLEKWEQFKKIKDIIFSKLEVLRSEKIINKNSQAIVKVIFKNTFSFNEHELKEYLNVAKVVIVNNNSDEIIINVDNANFIRCERCWNYYEQSAIDERHLCNRCAKIINEDKK
ncbi:MAG: isoleucine--tRNA ligase [Mycoplasmataceae bacterium]|nr:isoleucine--tRNA ligase [Mycoplasmataceae bacterium]